jgi:hypothetical protein
MSLGTNESSEKKHAIRLPVAQDLEVMSGIWSNRVDYSSPVGKAHWMDSGYLFPAIA